MKKTTTNLLLCLTLAGLGQAQAQFSKTFTKTELIVPAHATADKDKYVAGALGDVNGDGKLDIIYGDKVGYSLQIFENNSAASAVSFKTPLALSLSVKSQNFTPCAVHVVDLNGDNKNDLVISGSTLADGINSYISIFENKGSGSAAVALGDFPWHLDSLVRGGGADAFSAVGDLDQDGKIDIVSTPLFTGTGAIFTNKSTNGGAITLSNKIDIGFANTTRGLVIANATVSPNGDNYPDIWRENGASGAGIIFKNEKLPLASAGTQFSVSMNDVTPGGLAVAELRPGSGINDIVVTNDVGSERLTGSFKVTDSVMISKNTSDLFLYTTNSYSPSIALPKGANPREPQIADLDADGINDIVVALSGDTAIAIIKNNSTKSTLNLSNAVIIKSVPRAQSVRTGDVNGDGLIDIVVFGAAGKIGVHIQDKATGVANGTFYNTINVYPNPSQGEININMEGVKADGAVNFTLYNSVGQVVLTESAQASSSINHKIVTTGLNAGIYNLVVSSNAGQSLTKISVK